MTFLRQKIRWMTVEIRLKNAEDVSQYTDGITLVVPFSSLLSLPLPACFYADIETCGKATRQKCSTMEKSGNICQSGQKTDSRGPNMMSGSEAATADTVLSLSPFGPLHYSSSALIVQHTMPSLWSLASMPESTREAAKLLRSSLSWGGLGELSNKRNVYFCAWLKGWERTKEFDYSIMFLSQ